MGSDRVIRFSKEISAPGMWQGKVYAWPWVVDTRVLFYNKDLLARAGALPFLPMPVCYRSATRTR